LAIPLPQDEVEAASIVLQSLLVLGLVTSLTAGILAIFVEEIAQALGVPELKSALANATRRISRRRLYPNALLACAHW